jgi:lipoyl-dependent peroxiredoxin
VLYPMRKPQTKKKGSSHETQGVSALEGNSQGRQGHDLNRKRRLSDTQYSFATRFADGKGTNPEELIAAAHAGCFTMALSLILGEAKLTAEHLETTAEVTLEKVADGFAITAVHLILKGKVPGADQAKFEELAGKAKVG